MKNIKYNREINEKIAKLLGFKKTKSASKYGRNQWIYPENWHQYVRTSPCTELPNFLWMIDFCLQVDSEFKYGFDRDQYILNNK